MLIFFSFSLCRWSNIVYFKEFQRRGRLLLFVVDPQDGLTKLVSSFLIHSSLSRTKAVQVPTIEPFSFAQLISVRVVRGADDGSEACYLQSVYNDRSSLTTKFYARASNYYREGSMGAELAFI